MSDLKMPSKMRGLRKRTSEAVGHSFHLSLQQVLLLLHLRYKNSDRAHRPHCPLCHAEKGRGKGTKQTENGLLGLIYSWRCKGLFKLQILNQKLVIIAKAAFLQAWPATFCISFN